MKTLKKYLITLGVGLILVFLIISSKGIFDVTDAKSVFHILCDAFFAIGCTMAGIGLLVYTSNEGVFDGLVFGVTSFFNMFRKNYEKKYKDLYEYKESKASKKYSFGFLLICGMALLAVSVVMYLFSRKYV